MSKRLIIILSVILVISACFFIGIYSINSYTNTNTEDTIQLTKAEIESKLEELKKEEYEDGTYNLDTLEKVSYAIGYQVSFYQIGDNYTDKEFIDIVERLSEESTDGVISAGKYDGSVEISFNIKDKDTAIKLAEEFNQISIWDWKANAEINTGGTGTYEIIRNFL